METRQLTHLLALTLQVTDDADASAACDQIAEELGRLCDYEPATIRACLTRILDRAIPDQESVDPNTVDELPLARGA